MNILWVKKQFTKQIELTPNHEITSRHSCFKRGSFAKNRSSSLYGSLARIVSWSPTCDFPFRFITLSIHWSVADLSARRAVELCRQMEEVTYARMSWQLLDFLKLVDKLESSLRHNMPHDIWGTYKKGYYIGFQKRIHESNSQFQFRRRNMLLSMRSGSHAASTYVSFHLGLRTRSMSHEYT